MTKSVLPEGITYKQFTIRVDNRDRIVHIPLRESERFKQRIRKTEKMTTLIFKAILREFRGIRLTNKEQ